MKKMQIFEPAMCCPTGICGVGVDPELLRISTVLNILAKNNLKVERFNLSNAPQEFIANKAINDLINTQGMEALPATLLDGDIVVSGRYPTNDELSQFLDVPKSILGDAPKTILKVIETPGNSGDCGCSGGNCC